MVQELAEWIAKFWGEVELGVHGEIVLEFFSFQTHSDSFQFDKS